MPVASTPLTAPGITPPGDYALPPDRYHALLAERATCVRPDLREDEGRWGIGDREARPPRPTGRAEGQIAQGVRAGERVTATGTSAADWCGTPAARPGTRACTGRCRRRVPAAARKAARSVSDEPHASHPDVPDPVDEGAFGIDAFSLDDRLRLFHFAAAEKRHEYLWLLRAFDRGRANYQVLLHASDAVGLLERLAADHPAAGAVSGLAGVQPLLDALAEWQILDRSYDGTRAANLAEYRNRHYVYQFTQAGYRAYRAVEDVLGASLEDAQLSRLVFPDILGDLHALAEANTAGDGEEVYRKLGRLDSVLNEMAQRAARFYLMLGDLARTNDTRPEVFLTHKDTLLAHMREFTAELGRYAPLLAEAVEKAAPPVWTA